MTSSAQQSTGNSSNVVLYHYTSLERLESILKNRRLWASHVLFTNDRQEIRHTVNILRQRLSIQTSESKYAKFLSTYGQQIEHSLASILSTDMFVFCLSKDGDLLSQWRAYCPPDGGYAIGFLVSDLKKSIEIQDFNLMECIYSPQRQQAGLDSGLDRIISRLEMAGDDQTEQEGAFQYFEGFICALSACFKHPSFIEEKEWRIVSRPREIRKPEYRVVRNLAVPFVSINVELNDSMPVNRIIVGPNKDQELAIKGLKHLLKANGLSEEIVICSEIPYRTL